MSIIVAVLSIFIFLKTFYYGLYEIKQKNKLGGSTIIILSFVSLIAPNVIMFFRKG